MTPRLSVADITSYLSATGWVRQIDDWRGGSVWAFGDEYQILVPESDGFRDAQRRVRDILRALELVETRPHQDIASDIDAPMADVQWYRAPVVPHEGHLGLVDGVAALTGAQSVLTAVARTVLSGPHAVFDGAVPKAVRDLLATVRIGPILPSENLLTIRLPLDRVGPERVGAAGARPEEGGAAGARSEEGGAARARPDGTGAEGTRADGTGTDGAWADGTGAEGELPLARRALMLFQRVTPLLRDAAHTVRETGAIEVFDELVQEGVSADLCLGLARFAGADPGVGFEVGVRWARALPGEVPPEPVVFGEGTGRLLRQVGYRLRRLRHEDATVIGLVGTLFDDGRSDRFRINVNGTATLGSGERRRSLWVRLPDEAAYDLAIEAHRDGARVEARGTLGEVHGRQELAAVSFERSADDLPEKDGR